MGNHPIQMAGLFRLVSYHCYHDLSRYTILAVKKKKKLFVFAESIGPAAGSSFQITFCNSSKYFIWQTVSAPWAWVKTKVSTILWTIPQITKRRAAFRSAFVHLRMGWYGSRLMDTTYPSWIPDWGIPWNWTHRCHGWQSTHRTLNFWAPDRLIFIGDTKTWSIWVSPHFTTVHKRHVARWIRVCCKHAQGDPSQRCAGV